MVFKWVFVFVYLFFLTELVMSDETGLKWNLTSSVQGFAILTFYSVRKREANCVCNFILFYFFLLV